MLPEVRGLVQYAQLLACGPRPSWSRAGANGTSTQEREMSAQEGEDKGGSAIGKQPQGRRQSTGAAPISVRIVFARLKGREPKNPREADSGDG